MTNSNAIEIRGLTYRPDKNFEIRDMNLNVPTGSIYGFLGPNGAGKSTTIRLMLAMAKPDSGDVTILGSPVPSEIASVLSRTGYVPERPHLYPSLTVDEAIRLHASFYPTWDAKWASSLHAQFGLPDRKISKLSKGETGKLMMLLALSQRPELLILDEPTDGLDPMIRRDVLTAVLDYVADTKATVFISSHLVHELERMCDWVGLLDHGRMVAELPIDDFKKGVKRLRLADLSGMPSQLPFTVLSRSPNGSNASETWVVRGWDDSMKGVFDAGGASLREVIDLDLEEVFVEFLRSSRTKAGV
ncbi:MAG TPA: ABC transporter ATP-binding protein [Longimicrobiales bacterium]|nr:ABC transporter ATP-binding protein [Longimicrobiales bacterium]